jgi:predicted negative regulator of RcsB-dependent stress response
MSKQPEEIQTSDWDDFKASIGPLWDQWGNALLTLVLVVLVGIFAYRLYNIRSADRMESAWVGLASATTPASMAAVALENKGTAVGWIAGLRAGNLYLTEARAGLNLPATTQPSGAAPVAGKDVALSQAAASFNQVLSDPKADLVYKLNAKLGLASVEEAKGNLDKARELYEAVEKEGKQSYPWIAGQANAMLGFLPNLTQELKFAMEPPSLPQVPGIPGMPIPTPAQEAGPGSSAPPLLAAPPGE